MAAQTGNTYISETVIQHQNFNGKPGFLTVVLLLYIYAYALCLGKKPFRKTTNLMCFFNDKARVFDYGKFKDSVPE